MAVKPWIGALVKPTNRNFIFYISSSRPKSVTGQELKT